MAAGFLTLYLPGAAWQAWSPRPAQDAASRLADAIGLSLAFTALAALAGFVLGLRFSGAGLAGIYTALALALAAGWIRRRHSWTFNPGVLMALFGFGLFVAWRLYQARSLLLPAWVDSVHHVLIVRVILEKGGLPADLSPYLAVPFYYHYAFHAVAAVFAFWARLAPDQAVLILGQVLNAAICLSVYRLSMTLWKDVRRAAAAALLVAFVFHMPAYYLTWGRYTLLTGLVLLPLAMAAAFEISRSDTLHTEALLRLGVLTGGLFLAHYLAAILLAVFLVLLGLERLWLDFRRRGWDRAVWTGLLAGTGIGILLALPWLARVYQYSAGEFRISAVLGADAPDQVYFSGYLDYLWYLAGPYRNHALLALAAVGLVFALRRGPGRLAGAWGLTLAAFALPWGLRLGPFRPDHLVIVLFLPGRCCSGTCSFRPARQPQPCCHGLKGGGAGRCPRLPCSACACGGWWKPATFSTRRRSWLTGMILRRPAGWGKTSRRMRAFSLMRPPGRGTSTAASMGDGGSSR